MASEGNAKWKYVDSRELGEEDIFDMVTALMPLLVKWKEIGTALGLRHSVLEIIEATNGENTRMCMQGVLVQYVRKSYNCDRFGDPSWMGICKAVAHPAGGGSEETALAISKKHLTKGKKSPQFKKAPQTESSQDDPVYSIGCPVHLLQYDWFHGKLTEKDSQKLLTAMVGSCFLVREDSSKAGTLFLSVKNARGFNDFPISRGPGWYEVTGSSHKFETVGDLVTYYKSNSIGGYSRELGSPCVRRMEAVSDPVYSIVGRENPYQRGEPEDLVNCSWYYGEMSVRQAEKKLSKLEDSKFLIWVDRESELYLSLKLTDRMSHFKIERGPGWYTVQDTFQLFPSVSELVAYYNLEQLPAASNVVNYYNLNGEFHSAVRGLQHIYDYIAVNTTTMHVYDYISTRHGEDEKHVYDYITASDSQSYILLKACKNGDVHTVRKLLMGGVVPNLTDDEGRTPLFWACSFGYEEIVKLLIEFKADVNAQNKKGNTALSIASQEGKRRVVEVLVRAKVNIDLRNSDSCTALHLATLGGHSEVVDILISAKANLDLQSNTGWTALYMASYDGFEKIVKLLIDAGCNIHMLNEDSATALHAASQQGHNQIVQMLIASKAKLELRDIAGTTALWYACFKGHSLVAQSLISADCFVNTQNNSGISALYGASRNGHIGIVKQLLAAKANVNTATVKNMTPLMVASREGHVSAVQLLISKGARLQHRDMDGMTAYDFAKRKGHRAICKVLSDAM